MLSPDKNTRMLRLYHTSAKWMIPQVTGAILLDNANIYMKSAIQISMIGTFGFHSYVSTSALITDYVKHPHVGKFARNINIKSHGLAALGMVYYISNFRAT